MKLVTFDAGRVGRLEGDVVVELDCVSTREWFVRGGQVGETGVRLALADVRLRAPIVPKKFFHTAGNFADHDKELQAVDWSHPVHKGIVFFYRSHAPRGIRQRRAGPRLLLATGSPRTPGCGGRRCPCGSR
ncbi:MAG: Rv2993c-like domain-containing protein, partial [Trebonia sp.]